MQYFKHTIIDEYDQLDYAGMTTSPAPVNSFIESNPSAGGSSRQYENTHVKGTTRMTANISDLVKYIESTLRIGDGFQQEFSVSIYNDDYHVVSMYN